MIDKMYMMFPSYKLQDDKLVYESYNNELTQSEQSIGAIQNRLIELYKSVLLNENVIKDVMTPIDFDHIKNDIRSIFKQIPISNLSLFDPIQDIDVKYSFLSGKAGVGQEANALIDYVLGSLSDISITNFDINKSNVKLDSEFSYELDEKDLKYYQKQLNLSDEQIKGLKKIKISNSLSAILNAFVDIAKDPYITEGNWVTMTTNTGNLLLRKGVHPFYVNAFLAQPVIKDYIEFTEQYERSETQSLKTQDEFRKQYVSNNLKDNIFTIRDISINYSDIYNQLFKESDINIKLVDQIKKGNNSFISNNILNLLNLQNIMLTANELAELRKVENTLTDLHSSVFFGSNKDIIDNNLLENLRKNIISNTVSFQAQVFNNFLKYQNASKAIKLNIDASKFMVNGMGKNVTSLNISKNIVDSLLFKESKFDPSNTDSNIILGFESKFRNPDGSQSMFSKYYDNIILGVQNIVKSNPKLFLSANPVVQNTFDEISYSVYSDILVDDTLGTQLERDFYSYTMSGFTPLNISIEERRDLLTKFPSEFKTFKETNKGIYEIIDQLTIKPGEAKLEYITLSNRKKSAEYEETLVNSWYDLMNDDSELSDNLIKYSYLTSGFAMSINQFYTYIPSEWFIKNKVNRFVIDVSNEYSNRDSNDNNFIDQFFLTNLEDRRRVRVTNPRRIDTKGRFKQLNKGFINKNAGKSDYFTIRKTDTGDIYYKLLGYTTDNKGIYSRFIPNINNEMIDIRPLNTKDARGNKIINYNTNGLILKLSNPNLANIIDMNYYNELNNLATKPRDLFFKNNYVDNKIEEFSINEEELTIPKEVIADNLNEEDSPCKGGINI